MLKEIRFALYSVKKNIQGSAELRGSFLANIVGMMINNSAFVILWIFFVKSVGVINGWTAADIVGMLGFNTLAFGAVFSVGHGIRKTAEYVSSGAFDRFMLSPRNLLSRVSFSSLDVSSIGDVFFGISCLFVYIFLTHASVFQILSILSLIFLTVLVFLSAAITVYSASFYFTDADSVTRGFFDLFLSASLFHGGAFQGAMRFVFTFLIPSLLIGILPAEAVKDVSLEKILLIGVLAFAWFFFSRKIWNRAVRKYESASFMTFGS